MIKIGLLHAFPRQDFNFSSEAFIARGFDDYQRLQIDHSEELEWKMQFCLLAWTV